jgi:hypothetical protein
MTGRPSFDATGLPCVSGPAEAGACRPGGRPTLASDQVRRGGSGTLPTGFPAAARLNRMGRRFSSHGHLISRTCGIWQTLHSRRDSSSLSHRAFALRGGISAGASMSVSAPQAAVYLSASPNDRLDSVCRRLLHRTADFPHRIRRCAVSDRPLSTSCIVRALRRAVGIRRLPFGTLLRFAALHARSAGSLPLRSSLSTDSFAADRFNESCKIDASVVSCRFPARKPGPIRARRHEAGSQR